VVLEEVDADVAAGVEGGCEVKITTTGFYKRRDGKKARVVCVDAPGDYPVIVTIDPVGDTNCYSTTQFGVFKLGESNNEFDLIAPWTEPAEHSLEWARSLPLETKLWTPGMLVDKWHTVQFVKATSYVDSTEWHIVGSASWANALPEGTRLYREGWHRGEYVVKTNGHWKGVTVPGAMYVLLLPTQGERDDWLLHTAPTLRPWKPEEVPHLAMMRLRDTVSYSTILGSCESGLTTTLRNHNGEPRVSVIAFSDAFKDREHSTDNGRTWKPCGVEVTP